MTSSPGPARRRGSPPASTAASGALPLVAVDPGTRRAGVAVFVEGRLVAWFQVAGDGTPRGTATRILAAVRSVVSGPVAWVAETPQDYPGHPAPAADLQALREVLDALGVPKRARALPRTWKGNVPKAVHVARAFRVLDGRDVAPPGQGDAPDAADAVALGLWRLGRTGRGGVAPRG